MSKYHKDPRYTQLKEEYPNHWERFNGMLNRVRDFNIESSFIRDFESLERFIQVIGPIPDGMECPTVGRLDHNKGYVFDTDSNRWNFRWQEYSENSSESASRMLVGPNSPNKNPNHNSKTGELQRIAVESPNHNSKLFYRCSCGKVGKGPGMFMHFKACSGYRVG